MKKIISLICFISLLTLSTVAYAGQNIKIQHKFLDDWSKGKILVGDLIDSSTATLDFKNEMMEIHARPTFSLHFELLKGNSDHTVNKKYDNVVYTSAYPMEVKVPILTATGMLLKITNKTEELLSIDLNKSVISVGNYYGKPFAPGVKYADQVTAMLPPLIIPPHATIETTLYRADYSLDETGRGSYGRKTTEWQCPADLHPGNNIFGQGYQALAVGISDLKYVTFKLNANIPSTAFDPYLKKK